MNWEQIGPGHWQKPVDEHVWLEIKRLTGTTDYYLILVDRNGPGLDYKRLARYDDETAAMRAGDKIIL